MIVHEEILLGVEFIIFFYAVFSKTVTIKAKL